MADGNSVGGGGGGCKKQKKLVEKSSDSSVVDKGGRKNSFCLATFGRLANFQEHMLAKAAFLSFPTSIY